MDKTIKNILMFFLVVLIFYLLKELSSLLLPLALALLLSFLFHPFVLFLIKLKFPKYLIFPLVSIISIGIFYALLTIIFQTISDLIAQKDFFAAQLNHKFTDFIVFLRQNTNLVIESDNITTTLQNFVKSDWLTSAASEFASRISSFTGSFVMFSLYYIFLTAGMSDYDSYIKYVGGDNGNLVLQTVEKIKKSINSYIIYKALINLITSTIVTTVCLIFGIKFAFFWGLAAFILNFIPNLGSIVWVGCVVIMGIIQFDSIKLVILIFVILSGTNFFIGNYIEPKIIGKKLELNILTVIFGLVFWGWIWGITGMMISVPLLVILKLILEQFSGLSVISRLMGYPVK